MKKIIISLKWKKLRYRGLKKRYVRIFTQHLANIFIIAFKNAKSDEEAKTIFKAAMTLNTWAIYNNIWLK